MTQIPTLDRLLAQFSLKHIGIGALSGLIFALLLIATLPKLYRAEMTIAPAERSLGIELGSALQNGQTAAVQFLMQRLGSAASTDFTAFQSRLKTGEVAKQVMNDPALLHGLFYKKWDKKGKKWRRGRTPDIATIREEIQKKIILRPVGTTNLKTVAYHHPDPVFATRFLNALFKKTDTVMKAQMQQRAITRIAYLQQQLKQPQTRDQEVALVAMLKEQEHLKMISAIDIPYAAIMLEAPIASAKPVSPKGSILALTFIIIGASAGHAIHRFKIKYSL